MMSRYPDGYFDLAIVDPPYGMGQRYNFRYHDDDNKKDYINISPKKEYFIEVWRVSKNVMLWGGNYFTDKLPQICKHWICWYKHQPINSFSDFELCATTFDKADRLIDLPSYGFNHADKRISKESTIHPTQKPISLYRYILMNYAKEGDKILDTHLGSGSIAIACHNLKYDLTACEIDEEYFNSAIKRLKQHQAQLTMF